MMSLSYSSLFRYMCKGYVFNISWRSVDYTIRREPNSDSGVVVVVVVVVDVLGHWLGSLTTKVLRAKIDL